MAVDTKADPKAEAKVEIKKVNLRAIIGDIVHPFTETRFTTDSYKLHDEDSWVKIQVEAGKLEKQKTE